MIISFHNNISFTYYYLHTVIMKPSVERLNSIFSKIECLILFFSQQFHFLCPYEFCALFVDFIFKLGGKIKVHKI